MEHTEVLEKVLSRLEQAGLKLKRKKCQFNVPSVDWVGHTIDTVLTKFHQAHPGLCKLKGFARCYGWWPNMDSSIEEAVKSCEECQSSRKMPTQTPLYPWEWPRRPQAQIDMENASPFMGQMFLMIVVSHSKWMEVLLVGATATADPDLLKKAKK